MRRLRLAAALAPLLLLAACRSTGPAPVAEAAAAPRNAPAAPAPLAEEEARALAAAEREAPELRDLEAGDLHLSDRELKIIGFTALVVVVIALLV